MDGGSSGSTKRALTQDVNFAFAIKLQAMNYSYKCSTLLRGILFIYLIILFKVLGIRPNVHIGYKTGGADRDHGLRHALLVHARYLHGM